MQPSEQAVFSDETVGFVNDFAGVISADEERQIEAIEQRPGQTVSVPAHLLRGAMTGAAIIAEGIETSEQADTLTARGVRVGQGFLYSPAVPEHLFVQLLGVLAA